MPLITMAEFSRLRCVSRPAIKKAVDTGRVILTDGMVDTENALNAIYGPKPKPTKKAPPVKVAKAKAKRQLRNPATVEAEDGATTDDDLSDVLTDDERHELAESLGEDMAAWTLRDKKASAKLKEAGERKVSLHLMERKKELVPRDLFTAAVQGINKAIDDHLHRLPAKLGPVVFALARRDGATELEVIRTLETEMGGAIRRATEDVARLEP